MPTLEELGWKKVIFAHDCFACEGCGDPICPVCDLHYSECDCPGPTQDDEYDYKEIKGQLWARPLGTFVEH